MNIAFLPDLSALAILVVILMLVRRQHSVERTNAWLLGLFITLIEASAHTFYPPHQMPGSVLHVIVLVCYLLAGLVFVWAAGDLSYSRGTRRLYLILNGFPLLLLVIAYGLNLRFRYPYLPALIIGPVIGVASSLLLRASWRNAFLCLLGWAAIGVVIARGDFRSAVYWALACVYATAAFNFYRRLKPGSTGRLAIVTGFAIWSLCFLLHPWVVHYPAFADIASHVWNMQKSLISIGMILVMLEEQVSSNEWLALHDELTGLPNRRMFGSRLSLALEQANRRKTSVALVVLDLNGFKKINDTLGHIAGDQVLREVSGTLRRSVRATDTVARLGGDEFIIVAADMPSESSVERFVDAVRNSVEHSLVINGQALPITASFGVAVYPDDATDAIKLLRLADQRMYRIKKKPVQSVHIEAGREAIMPHAQTISQA